MAGFPRRIAHGVLCALAVGACNGGPRTSQSLGVDPMRSSVGDPTASGAIGSPAAGVPFALVEVFSSEGCSSCPPVERAVDALDAGRPGVIVLSFHVDYWDYLGWRDPYSSAAATERQQSYVAAWGTRSTYTPMVVVQGEEHHLGTGGALAAAVERALATVPTVRIAATVHAATASPIVVDYVTEAAPEGSTVLVAAVEGGLAQHVMRGENAGETLHHEHVVRAWRVAPAGRGSTELTLPTGARADAIATVVFDGTKPIAARLSPNRGSSVAR